MTPLSLENILLIVLVMVPLTLIGFALAATLSGYLAGWDAVYSLIPGETERITRQYVIPSRRSPLTMVGFMYGTIHAATRIQRHAQRLTRDLDAARRLPTEEEMRRVSTIFENVTLIADVIEKIMPDPSSQPKDKP